MNLMRIFLATTFVTLSLAACSDEEAAPASSGSPSPPAQSPAPAASADIVATAESAGQFKTLVAAVKAADLEATLKGPGPFTVFAPTDDAFAKLPAGTIDTLLKPENKEQLVAILTYHVVAGEVPSTEAVKLPSAKTVNGKELTFDASSGSLKVNGATVIKADVDASNGVIHAIDTVLLPPQ